MDTGKKYILGIETSCDETAAAVVSSEKEILSHYILSQMEAHQPYGGVVPEIAAREHMSALDGIIKNVMAEAGMKFSELSGVAVTAGPGLIGGVMVGLMTAKAIAAVHNLPFIAVNHLEGHALTVRLEQDIAFPYLLLLVSGGHCQILLVERVGQYTRLGGTIDDALGEAFDKTAKMLGLPYPGGPQVEKLARTGDPHRFAFPKPLLGRQGCDFSFSGLKTAVRLCIAECEKAGCLTPKDKSDICASFQYTVGEVIKERLQNAIAMAKQKHSGLFHIVVAGGVAANGYLRSILEAIAAKHAMELAAPSLHLCTDNAAMIAWAGYERLALGFIDDLDASPRARWPLAD